MTRSRSPASQDSRSAILLTCPTTPSLAAVGVLSNRLLSSSRSSAARAGVSGGQSRAAGTVRAVGVVPADAVEVVPH
eukprot:5106283-Lingulodinium_polyedra.AAC.1